MFGFQEPFQFEEFLSEDFILKLSKPALVKGLDLETEQHLLVLGEFFYPFGLIKFGCRC